MIIPGTKVHKKASAVPPGLTRYRARFEVMIEPGRCQCP